MVCMHKCGVGAGEVLGAVLGSQLCPRGEGIRKGAEALLQCFVL